MKMFLALSVCFGAMLGVAAAQSSTLVTVKLPNATTIGTSVLPAGVYRINEVDNSGNSAVLQFSGPNGVTRTVMAIEVPLEAAEADKTEVVLRNDGEQLHIQKVVIAERPFAFQLLQ